MCLYTSSNSRIQIDNKISERMVLTTAQILLSGSENTLKRCFTLLIRSLVGDNLSMPTEKTKLVVFYGKQLKRGKIVLNNCLQCDMNYNENYNLENTYNLKYAWHNFNNIQKKYIRIFY